MSVLVTGGAGFIGSNLVDFLVHKEKSVIVVDDLSSGTLVNLSRSIDKIEFYQQKIEQFDFSLCSEITSVIHLAAQASVPFSISNFKESTSSNILGTIRVIDFCTSRQIPLIYASSSALYGKLPFGNDQNAEIDLLSPYAADKYAMEMYASVAFKLHKLSSVGLRFFNVYGPRQNSSSVYSGVISIFINRLLKQKSITINGGQQTRDFVYIDDVIKAIFKSLENASNEYMCEKINVLSGTSISINTLADTVIEILNSKSVKLYKSLRPGDVEHSSGSVKKMVRLLGTELDDMIQLREGLNRTINFSKKNGH